MTTLRPLTTTVRVHGPISIVARCQAIADIGDEGYVPTLLLQHLKLSWQIDGCPAAAQGAMTSLIDPDVWLNSEQAPSRYRELRRVIIHQLEEDAEAALMGWLDEHRELSDPEPWQMLDARERLETLNG